MRPEEYEGEMIDPRCDKCGTPGSHICAPTARELLDSVDRESFRAYAEDAHTEPDGSECQWAAYSLRLLDLTARVERVLALHKMVDAPEPWCEHCLGDDTHNPDGRFVPWPCPTIRILNGEEADQGCTCKGDHECEGHRA